MAAILDLRVMTADDLVEAGADLVAEQPELDPLVAPDVRTGRAAGAQLVHGSGHHAVLVLGLERKDLERHARLLTDGPGMSEVLLPGTAPQIGQLVFEPDLQIKGVQVPAPGLLGKAQGHGTVHATR